MNDDGLKPKALNPKTLEPTKTHKTDDFQKIQNLETSKPESSQHQKQPNTKINFKKKIISVWSYNFSVFSAFSHPNKNWNAHTLSSISQVKTGLGGSNHKRHLRKLSRGAKVYCNPQMDEWRGKRFDFDNLI